MWSFFASQRKFGISETAKAPLVFPRHQAPDIWDAQLIHLLQPISSKAHLHLVGSFDLKAFLLDMC